MDALGEGTQRYGGRMTAPEPLADHTSVFTRVSRRLPGTRDPGEDRLTEITAALIESDAGFAQRFVAALLKRETDGTNVSVRTQRPVAVDGTVRRVDLQLVLAGDQSTTTVWVEVKLDAPESGEQLVAYRKALHQYAGIEQSQLLLLVPSHRRATFEHHVRPEHDAAKPVDALVTWQEVADGLVRPSGSAAAGAEVTDWLVRQYLSYLQDCGATDRPLPSDEQLDHYEQLSAVAKGVYDTITRSRPNHPVSASSFNDKRAVRPLEPPQDWCQHESRSPTDGWQLEWGLATRADFEIGSRQQSVFYAGWVGFGGVEVSLDPTRWDTSFDSEPAGLADTDVAFETLLPGRKGPRFDGEQNFFFVRAWPADDFLGRERAVGEIADAIKETLGICERLGPPRSPAPPNARVTGGLTR